MSIRERIPPTMRTSILRGRRPPSELPTALEASSVYTVGYIGKRRYVRAVITKTSGTSIGAGAAFVLGLPSIAPVA